MANVDWRELGNAVEEQRKHPRTDPLAPFRAEVYATGRLPWRHYEAVESWWNISALLRSMAATLTQRSELAMLFRMMDQARAEGRMPMATGDAGDVLIDRAKGKRGYPPLPDDWADVAERALAGGKNSSGAYWGAAMLRAGGHHLPPHDAEERGRPGPGPQPGSGPEPPAAGGGFELG